MFLHLMVCLELEESLFFIEETIPNYFRGIDNSSNLLRFENRSMAKIFQYSIESVRERSHLGEFSK